ncbi:hypothetical protein GCM10020254_28480 [Streptomyces goshikiensis]
MTTPRDLMIIALDVAPERPVGRGDLALALAGAELLDLLADRTATLADDRIVPEPGHRPPAADPLLEAAAAALVREAPYESVADWLWRRGQDLPSAYLAALEAEGQLVRQRRRGQPTLADSPTAAGRRTAGPRPNRSWPRSRRPSGSAPPRNLRPCRTTRRPRCWPPSTTH